MRKALCSVLAVALLIAPGCATILGKAADQEVDVTTTPPGAQLIVNGVPTSATSPGKIEIDPSEDHSVQAVLGEAKASRAIRKTVRIWAVVVDGLLTGGIGVFVDYMTGALYQFEPKVHLNLGVAPPPMPTGSPTSGTTTQVSPLTQQSTNNAPCKVCGEPRGDATPCPHCGMD